MTRQSEPTTAMIDSEMLAAAREAGASDLFVMVAAVDPEAVYVSHNYVAREVARTLDGVPPEERPERLAEDIEMRGDFMTALWEGDLAEALYHADGTNRPLLIRLLNDDVILSALIEDRGSYESAIRWYQPEAERYGWEAVDAVNNE